MHRSVDVDLDVLWRFIALTTMGTADNHSFTMFQPSLLGPRRPAEDVTFDLLADFNIWLIQRISSTT